MQSNVFTAVFMPLALGVIMLGLGLGLTLEDFRRVVVYPRAVFVGLLCQTVLLPLACYGIAKGFALPPELAVGLMLLAASPGGATANLFSHLAKGDVALNITLTATNSILSLFTLPLIVNLSLEAFMGTEKSIPLQFDKVIQVFAVVLVPVGIGMLVRAKRPSVSERLQKPVKITSAVFLVLIIVAAVLKERANLVTFFRQVGLAALVFNLASMGLGYVVPLLVRLPKRQATAIGMEIGIHNGTLAIAIASAPTLLNNSTMAIPPAIYSLIMFFTAAAFGSIVARTNEEAAPAAEAEQPKAA
ncbi:bile acid:sodium symporter family protein [Polyangium spumosum]|uniref:Bile acid:sodium symporter family protein n=1 Tax=Polyangium spumosum TaxID=889282 RepID=A0A6N7Q1I3_9BACT|nr:bile acid:sodium symporter family protein [Polyangium spumosum]MRG98332.1 bile acid:sodium symporter family protein [Polyangium spumosum]